MRRAVFLDRDGVLNRVSVRAGIPHPPANLSDLKILPGVSDALICLKQKGFLLIVVTNQPDVARGTASREAVEEINDALASNLPIDEFRTCFHDDADDCNCRKPRPGALVDAAIEHQIRLGSSFMIGDRWKDIEAGIRAGCRTIFIDYGYKDKRPDSYEFKVRSLHEASSVICHLDNT